MTSRRDAEGPDTLRAATCAPPLQQRRSSAATLSDAVGLDILCHLETMFRSADADSSGALSEAEFIAAFHGAAASHTWCMRLASVCLAHSRCSHPADINRYQLDVNRLQGCGCITVFEPAQAACCRARPATRAWPLMAAATAKLRCAACSLAWTQTVMARWTGMSSQITCCSGVTLLAQHRHQQPAIHLSPATTPRRSLLRQRLWRAGARRNTLPQWRHCCALPPTALPW